MPSALVVPVPSTVGPSLKVTVPAVHALVGEITVAVNRTASPGTDGLSDDVKLMPVLPGSYVMTIAPSAPAPCPDVSIETPVRSGVAGSAAAPAAQADAGGVAACTTVGVAGAPTSTTAAVVGLRDPASSAAASARSATGAPATRPGARSVAAVTSVARSAVAAVVSGDAAAAATAAATAGDHDDSAAEQYGAGGAATAGGTAAVTRAAVATHRWDRPVTTPARAALPAVRKTAVVPRRLTAATRGDGEHEAGLDIQAGDDEGTGLPGAAFT
jgi:hypothetical protein